MPTGSSSGEHGGAAGYTVGQRRGLGVALGEPRYVSRIDAATNTIVLGRREDLETTTIALDDVSFVAGPPPAGAARRSGPRFGSAIARRRSRRRSARPVRPSPIGVAAGPSETDDPVWAAAPGQAAVLYQGEVVLGRRPDRPRLNAGAYTGPVIGPAFVLAVLLGILATAVYVLVRGSVGGDCRLVLAAAILGAWAGTRSADASGSTSSGSGDFRVDRGAHRRGDRDRPRDDPGCARAAGPQDVSR